MNDKELLELAAKAAGLLKPDGVRKDGSWWWFNSTMDGVGKSWNPLTDDGDALRLAVALGLLLNVHRTAPYANVSRPCVEVKGYLDRNPLSFEKADDNGESLQAATRRAIVRAAAEMGKRTP